MGAAHRCTIVGLFQPGIRNAAPVAADVSVVDGGRAPPVRGGGISVVCEACNLEGAVVQDLHSAAHLRGSGGKKKGERKERKDQREAYQAGCARWHLGGSAAGQAVPAGPQLGLTLCSISVRLPSNPTYGDEVPQAACTAGGAQGSWCGQRRWYSWPAADGARPEPHRPWNTYPGLQSAPC